MSTSIASSFSSCLAAYEEAIVALRESGSNIRNEISLSELEDELGRLKVWAGNIAAHKVGRSSMDWRLRDASPLRDRIIGLLQDMDSLLREAIPVINGNREAQDEDASDTDSSLSDDQETLPDQPQRRSTTELQQTVLDIVDIIDCLYKLSITIRNPAPHDRLVKAASVDTSFFEEWDILHVKNKFPVAKNALAVKLGRAISRRRQYLKYREKHHKKLAQDLQPLNPATTKLPLSLGTKIVPATALPSKDFNNYADALQPTSEVAPSVVATTVLTQTTASEFINNNTEFEVESDSGLTQTSYATSAGNGVNLSIPPPPKESQGGRPFECPYCFTIISIKNLHSWKKHLFRDLQPYVCTFDSCSKGSKMFDSRHEWFDHELLAHRKEWYCNAECEKSFTLQSDFEDHMWQTHANTFSEKQLETLVAMCQRPVDVNSETQCPLCDETTVSTKQLCRHLARHLEALALFALPRNNGEEKDKEEESFGSDRAQLSDVSRGLSKGSLTFSSKSRSTSEGSELGSEIDSLGEVSRLLDSLNNLEKLPSSFAELFQREFRYFLDYCYDSTELQIFKDVGNVILGPNFQQVMDSESNVKDIISLFYLEATASCEKHQTVGSEIWIDSLNKAAASFVNLMVRTVTFAVDGNDMKEPPGLIASLKVLRNRLHARAAQARMLRETKESEVSEPAKETDRLLSPDWAKCWGVTAGEVGKFLPQEISRQENIHSIWTSERTYYEGLDTMIAVYQDDLIDDPSITEDGQRLGFVETIFAKADGIRKLHTPLLKSLRARLEDQGPFVESISGIFHTWFSDAVRQAYLDYAKEFPSTELLIGRMMNTNSQFKRAFEGGSARLDWLNYLRKPMGRIQVYAPLLINVRDTTWHRKTDDLKQLQLEIDELKSFNSAFQSYVHQRGEQNASALVLAGRLFFPKRVQKIDLNLKDPRRQLFYKGDLIQQNSNGNLTSSLACLFDNYFILTAPEQSRLEAGSSKPETMLEIKEKPVPMSLLLLQSGNKEPVSSMEIPPGRGVSQSLYPFSIKHLGKEKTYKLYASSEESRNTWQEWIGIALELHVSYQEPQSPFSLRVLSSQKLQPLEYPSINRTVRIKGSALDNAIQEFQPVHHHVIPHGVTCATTFTLSTLQCVATGTNEGFCVWHTESARGWKSFVRIPDVKQIFVMEEFNIFLVLASEKLWAYPAKALWDYLSGEEPGSSASKPPPRVQVAERVEFFVAGRMKDRTLLIYATKDGRDTIFNVLEPIYHETTRKSKYPFVSSRAGKAGFLRKFDQFSIPAKCYGVNMFNQYLAISTFRSFELLTLDKVIPMTIPNFEDRAVKAIQTRLQGQKPLGMFRLPHEEFFCCYEETGAYINKHGDVSRSVVMEFISKSTAASVVDQYLILFHDDFVEIRDVSDGRLRQVIAGENIRCLDDGEGGSRKRNVLLAMSHPEQEDQQLILKLRLRNEELGREQLTIT